MVVAEELHFGRAAERLLIAQPAVSQTIRQLERELGVTLLTRVKRRVRVTAAGEAFLTEARAVLRRAESAVEIARAAARAETGRLIVGLGQSASGDAVRRALAAFRRRFPSVDVVLRDMASAERTRALSAREIDVTFDLPPFADAALRAEVIFREPLLAALPEGHPLSRRRSVPLASLGNEAFAFCGSQVKGGFCAQARELCTRAGFEIRVAHEADGPEAALAVVASNGGVTLLKSMLAHLRPPGVFLRPFDEPWVLVTIAVVWHEDNRSPVLANFLEVVRDATGSDGRPPVAT